MPSLRPTPAIAFLVGTLGIALFSLMDAVMKGLVLAIGAYATMLWRSLFSVSLAGVLYLPGRHGWPAGPVLRPVHPQGVELRVALVDL